MQIHTGALRNALKVFESAQNRNRVTFGQNLTKAPVRKFVFENFAPHPVI